MGYTLIRGHGVHLLEGRNRHDQDYNALGYLTRAGILHCGKMAFGGMVNEEYELERSMPRRRKVVGLQGCLNVAYTREDGEWFARALEFNILGYGRTRAAALSMLRELVEIYLLEVAQLLSEGKQVNFFHPSDPAAWNDYRQLDVFSVRFSLNTATQVAQKTVAPKGLGKLVTFIDSLDDLGVELVPA